MSHLLHVFPLISLHELTPIKAIFHLAIFDIPMRPLREDQRHRLRFTR